MIIEMTLTRTKKSPLCTIGELRVDAMTLATLEPPERSEKPRAIPAQTYRVVRYNSPKHGENTLLLCDVPDFEFVEIHAGNYPRDTEACILVGLTADKDRINSSRLALAALNRILAKASDISLTIIDIPTATH